MLRGDSKVQQRDVIAVLRRAAALSELAQLVKAYKKMERALSRLPDGSASKRGLRCATGYASGIHTINKPNVIRRVGGASDDS
jgi:hypothetical protein